MKSKTAIVEQFKRHKALANGGLGTQRENVKLCQAFYAGHFDEVLRTMAERAGDRGFQERLIAFNRAKPYVNAARGTFIQDRRKPKYLARQQVEKMRRFQTDYVNHASDYARDNANADAVETRQDLDMLVGGFGAVETCLAYGEGYASHEPNGEILMMRLDPLGLGWDPASREPNLLDATFVYYTKEYHIDEAKTLFDEPDDTSFEQANGGQEESSKVVPNPEGGGTYSHVMRQYDWVDANSQDETEKKMVKVHFYQWQEIEPYWRADNPLYAAQTPQEAAYVQAILSTIAPKPEEQDDPFLFDPKAEILNCSKDIKSKLEAAFGGVLNFIEFKRKVYYRATISGDVVFNTSRNDSQQGFSIKFKTGDFDETRKIWVGMITAMIDPILAYNKAFTQQLRILANAAQGGYFYEQGAIEDEKAFERTVLDVRKNTKLAHGALAEGRIQSKRESVGVTGLESLMSEASNALPEVNGLDRTFLGSSESRTETAALQRQRMKQVRNTLACYADAISLYQREHARMMLDLMRVWARTATGMTFRMEDDNGQESLVPLMPGPLEAEYDIAIEEAPDSATEKEERIQVLLNMGQVLLGVGDASGKVAISAAVSEMNLDAKMRRKLLEALEPQQNPVDPNYVKQLEDMVKSFQSQSTQAQLAKLVAETDLDVAKTHETKAKTVKTLEEAQKVDVETNIAARQPVKETNVNL